MKSNNWSIFSRGLCVALLILASFCGLCGLGAALPQIPWFLIAGGICLLLIVSASIWALGYKSRQVSDAGSETHGEEAPLSKSKEKPFDYEKEE